MLQPTLMQPDTNGKETIKIIGIQENYLHMTKLRIQSMVTQELSIMTFKA